MNINSYFLNNIICISNRVFVSSFKSALTSIFAVFNVTSVAQVKYAFSPHFDIDANLWVVLCPNLMSFQRTKSFSHIFERLVLICNIPFDNWSPSEIKSVRFRIAKGNVLLLQCQRRKVLLCVNILMVALVFLKINSWFRRNIVILHKHSVVF